MATTAAPRVLILRAPGTNCDEETGYAFEQAGAVAERLHINRLIENPTLGERFQILCLPGGFSFGDDIAAGRILASRLSKHLGGLIRDFCDGDRLVLGVCNGFQVLMRLGILTEGLADKQVATLTWNDHGRFEDRWVHLRTDQTARRPTPCVFLKGIDRMYLPMAHAEGKFVTISADVRNQLAAAGQLALRYTTPDGQLRDEPLDFPHNPNGAEANVAGLCDPSGRIFGLMPHPERHLDPTHHPFWTRRESQPERGDGYQMFKNAVDYFG
jgi:phosphoribosylformylglycinamidine synthase